MRIPNLKTNGIFCHSITNGFSSNVTFSTEEKTKIADAVIDVAVFKQTKVLGKHYLFWSKWLQEGVVIERKNDVIEEAVIDTNGILHASIKDTLETMALTKKGETPVYFLYIRDIQIAFIFIVEQFCNINSEAKFAVYTKRVNYDPSSEKYLVKLHDSISATEIEWILLNLNSIWI